MCGIAGFVGIKKPNFDINSIIQIMTNTMVHRGPDDEGHCTLSYSDNFAKNYVALGHRRLEVIDLTPQGHQPMFNRAGTIGIIFNGEVYNYVELRQELESMGHSFISQSDTEVVLRSYEVWGVECFRRFNGMWALAIVDKNNKKLVLSRDRFGKKPLYYYQTEDAFIFASEIKALLVHPFVKKKPNYEKIFRYIAYNYRYTDIDDFSFFEHIYQIPKNSYFEIDEKLNVRKEKYWHLDPLNMNEDISDKEAVERFRDIFIDGVKIRLRSDVPVGCMLSGGMDSTSITCVAYKILKKNIITFSGITGEKKGIYDESQYIDSVVRETKATHHYIRPTPSDIFETVNEMLSFHDEPVCTVTWYSLFLIAKQVAQKDVTVVLNGHAGDELLAGYWDHYHYNFYDLFERGDIENLFHEIEMWKKNHGRNPEEIGKTIRFISAIKKNRKNEILKFVDYSHLFDTDVVKKFKKDIELSSPFEGELLRRLHIELMQDGVPTVLRPEDRNTMSQSIESRSPFLDYRLVEYCYSLPNRFKIRHGLGKWILREAMKGVLPEDVRTRKDKAGFIAPADEWFRTVNKMQIMEMINSDAFKSRGMFDLKALQRMFDEHCRREKNHQMVLWQLMNLELWFRRFFDE